MNTEPFLLTPSGGFNAVGSETLYDAYVTTSVDERGFILKDSGITILGGQAITNPVGQQFSVRIPLPNNNSSNILYRINVRGPAGVLSAADVDVEYRGNASGNFEPANLNQQIVDEAGLVSMDVRVTMKSTSSSKRVNAIYVEYIT